jgi:hypothetical protein
VDCKWEKVIPDYSERTLKNHKKVKASTRDALISMYIFSG